MGIFDSFKKKRPDKSSSEVRQETPARPQEATSGKWKVGDRIQTRYEIHRILGGPGKSGMGIVYVCYDLEGRVPVAVKTFQDKFLQDRASIERFKREAETWVRLEKNYNIVQANYVQEIDGRPYIFLEYIVGDEKYGTDLSGWIRKGVLSIPLTLDFAIQFCHGMIHADSKFREMGKLFVHRDIKPSNIMITKDKIVKITDFGLVRAFAESGEEAFSITSGDESHPRLGLSKSGNICGTPPYMSPEQCRGEKDIDARSDIYSFGCVVYEMVTRKYVFDVRTLDEFIYHHLKTVPKSPNVQKELDRLVMKCLEKDPGKRYQDFNELDEGLSELYHRLTGKVVKQPEAAALEAGEVYNKGFSLANLGLYEEAIGCFLKALQLNTPNLADAHCNLGITYHLQGNLDAAIVELKEALRLNPNYANAHYGLGATYADQMKIDAAIIEYKEALKLDPDDTGVHCNLGNAYRAQGNLDAAIEEYKEALRIDTSNAQAHNNLGVTYDNQGKIDAALGEYKEALRLDPNDAGAHCNLGVAYLHQGNLDAATEECKEALRLVPNHAHAHYTLGLAYHGQGQLDKAIAEYRQALTIDPDNKDHQKFLSSACAELEGAEAIEEDKLSKEAEPDSIEAWNSQTIALANLGKYQESIACCDKVLEIDPEHVGAWYNKGLSLENLGQLIEATKCFERAAEIDPTFYHAWDGKARVLGKLGNHQESTYCCNKALEINPVLAPTWTIKGISLGKLGHHQEALECFGKALKINQRLHLAWNGKGMVLNELGRVQEAIECYDKALEINPSEDFIWKYKGDSLNGLGRYQEAIECYDKVLELDPNNADVWNCKGNSLGYSGRDKDALACYDRALEINPNIDFVWCSKGASLGALGRYKEAIDCCEKALKINPHYAEVWSNKGLYLRALGRNQEAADSFRKFIEFAPDKYATQIREAKNIIRQLEGST
jgi:tetratricopeptide (TPR) repeat protein/tRNA A-37 threonylcarbamoyl transferase component Bud32